MKVYAKFRIDIDKEDESIYTQKAVNLMQKLGCKAEKLYSSMERYTFTVDIKKAVYRELMKLKKEIDQVFQYDEDTEEDDDELLDIIEPGISGALIYRNIRRKKRKMRSDIILTWQDMNLKKMRKRYMKVCVRSVKLFSRTKNIPLKRKSNWRI